MQLRRYCALQLSAHGRRQERMVTTKKKTLSIFTPRNWCMDYTGGTPDVGDIVWRYTEHAARSDKPRQKRNRCVCGSRLYRQYNNTTAVYFYKYQKVHDIMVHLRPRNICVSLCRRKASEYVIRMYWMAFRVDTHYCMLWYDSTRTWYPQANGGDTAFGSREEPGQHGTLYRFPSVNVVRPRRKYRCACFPERRRWVSSKSSTLSAVASIFFF